MAIYLMCESKKGISANQLKRTIKVSYKTAWYLCHRIREALKTNPDNKLSGTIEVDEAYIGGKAENMHSKVKAKKLIGPSGQGKTMVIGAIERDGDVHISRITERDRETLHTFIRSQLARDAERVITDEWQAYDGIDSTGVVHETVAHGKKEYVREGNIHTNTIEGVWALFKRSIVGSFHHISDKHIDRYLDEFEFRFNNRNNPFLFRDCILQLLNSSNLEYKELVKS